MKIIDVINEILKMSPLSLKMENDNSGLQVGDVKNKLNNIMVALDVSKEAIRRAEKNDVNLIVAHHPLIFNAIKSVDYDSITGQKIIDAIRAGISIYACHTNFDFAPAGLNDYLAEKLGLFDLKPVLSHEERHLYKLVVFVPKEFEAKIKKALFSIGAGVIGEYAGCSFSVAGDGSFNAPDSSDPFVGRKGGSNIVKEVRVEMVIKKHLIDRAAYEILKVHPYEEPAFDIYPLISKDAKSGLGRIGELKRAMPFDRVLQVIKGKLKIKNLRYVGAGRKKIKRVAVCSGSGGSLINSIIKKGADLFITGDIKYHEAIAAKEAGLSIIDAGHHGTEIIFVDLMKKRLSDFLRKRGCVAKVLAFKSADPFNTI